MGVLHHYHAIGTGGEVSGSLAADIVGPIMELSNPNNILEDISVQIICGAGGTGQFFIQGSNYFNATLGDPGTDNWENIPQYDSDGVLTTLAISGSAVNFMSNMSDLAHAFLRVIYTRTSGSGSVDVWINGKGT